MSDAEPVIPKTPKPSNRFPHRYYPEIVYRFNDTLLRWWKTHALGYLDGEKVAFFTASFFSGHTRTFHWVSIYPTLWNSPGRDEVHGVLDKLLEELKTWSGASEEWTKWRRSEAARARAGEGTAIEVQAATTEPCAEIREKGEAWDRLLSDLPTGHLYDDARRVIVDAVNDSAGSIDPEALHRAALGIYSGYHHRADTNVEGVLTRLLELVGTKVGSGRPQLGFLLGKTDIAGDDKTQPADWFLVDNDTSDPLERASLVFPRWQNVRDQERSQFNLPSEHEEIKKSRPQELIETFYSVLLGDRNDPEKGGLPFGRELAMRKFVALIPVYAVWHGDLGIGGVRAVILVWFKDTKLRARWIKEVGPKLAHGLSLIASEVAASAESLALAHPISPPYDLLSHFLKVLPFVQDWEAAWVVDSETNRVAYHYKRKAPEGDSAKWDWVRRDCDACVIAHAEGRYRNHCECGLYLPTTQSEEIVRASGTNGDAWFMWWTNGGQGTKSLWNEDFIPAFGSEFARFERFAVCFQFPRACHIPDGEEAREYLREVYVHQQLELMGVLLQKVRARRAALRSAVSAIMGRNMSHNIGSHVLARYSNEIRNEVRDEVESRCARENDASQEARDYGSSIPEKERADHRAEFLAYLQRRMDFLAEIATSDKSFWAQPLALSNQIRRLNYEAEQKRTGRPPVLLSRITGKDKLRATVEFGAPRAAGDGYELLHESRDVLISCPSGEVGIQALFSVLENVIRNSARHGTESRQEEVRLFVVVAEESRTHDLIKILIIDPRTQLTRDGCVKREPIGEAKGEDRKVPLILDQKIRHILREESLLNDDGSPNPQYWGIREMQICAHFLRGRPLSDLEQLDVEQHPILSACVHPLEANKFCLGYELYLTRAKLATVVLAAGQEQYPQANEVDGIQVLIASAGTTWRTITQAAQGYGFLLIETLVAANLGSVDSSEAACLPVRQVHWKRKKIIALLNRAALSGAGESQWMESLHEMMALDYQAKRKMWSNRQVWGVAVKSSDGAMTLPDSGEQETPMPRKLNWVRRAVDTEFEPLPKSWIPAVEALKETYLGTAWIDHPQWDNGHGDFSLTGAAFSLTHRLGESHQQQLWACAEATYSDSLHLEYLQAAARDAQCWELLAAALARVAVLDERVQSAAKIPVRGGIPLPVLWSSAGIWVPPKEACDLEACDLDAPNLRDCRAFLQRPSLRPEQFPIDFLVIHLTILERLHNENGDERLGNTLTSLVNETKADGAVVIVVTGRGVPTAAQAIDAHLLSGVRYLPVSALLEYVVARPSKLGLMRALWSSSRPLPHD